MQPQEDFTETPRIRRLTPEELALGWKISDLGWLRDGRLVWLEHRGRDAALVLSNPEDRRRRDLTRDVYPRARAGYGGGDFTVFGSSVFFVADEALYRIDPGTGHCHRVAAAEHPLSSPAVCPGGSWVAVVAAGSDRDRLCLVESATGRLDTVFEQSSFCMQPAWDPGGQRLAWTAWDDPWMPWQESRIWVAAWDEAERRLEPQYEITAPGGRASISQPAFSPDGRWLACVSDAGGWCNVEIRAASDGRLMRRYDEEAEYTPPLWVYGIRSFAWLPDASGVLALGSRGGKVTARVLPLEGRPRSIPLEGYGWLGQPAVSEEGCVAVLASGADRVPAVLVLRDGAWTPVHEVDPACFNGRTWSRPETLVFPGASGDCFGLWYPPVGSDSPRGVVIKVHGGPTSQQQEDWDPEVQFFTTRGWGVLAVNYTGSWGYGRRYRDALDGRWGETEVEDIVAAGELAGRRWSVASPRLWLLGGSAGGYSALLALARRPGRFGGALVRYPLVDPAMLLNVTHRFERRYLDTLIGPWPEARERYESRSPLQLADRIRDPVILFHGDADPVVPVAGTRAFADRLRQRGVPVRCYIFPDEGHGWRRPETVRRYYALVERVLESAP
ncbi:MAG: prolyl oligopeptidase family serine peptidase [Acidobacteriota bacterium]